MVMGVLGFIEFTGFIWAFGGWTGEEYMVLECAN